MKKKEIEVLVSDIRNNVHCIVESYGWSEKDKWGTITISANQKYGKTIYSVRNYLNSLGYRTDVLYSRRIVIFDIPCEKPLFKKGDKFKQNGDDGLVVTILGIEEGIVDYRTLRTGLCYRAKDSEHTFIYSVPCLDLDRESQKFGYVKIE